jgi:hypothetical protein
LTQTDSESSFFQILEILETATRSLFSNLSKGNQIIIQPEIKCGSEKCNLFATLNSTVVSSSKSLLATSTSDLFNPSLPLVASPFHRPLYSPQALPPIPLPPSDMLTLLIFGFLLTPSCTGTGLPPGLLRPVPHGPTNIKII